MKKHCSIVLIFKKTSENIINKNTIDKLLKTMRFDFNQAEYYYYDSKKEKEYSKVYGFRNIKEIYNILDEQRNTNLDEKSVINIAFYKKKDDVSTWPDFGIYLNIFKNYIKIEVDMTDTIINIDFINRIIKSINNNNLIINNGFVHYYSKKKTNWMIRGTYVDFMLPSEIIFTKKMEKWLINPISKIPDIYYINIISKEFINDNILKKLIQTITNKCFSENNNYICFQGYGNEKIIKTIIGKEKFI